MANKPEGEFNLAYGTSRLAGRGLQWPPNHPYFTEGSNPPSVGNTLNTRLSPPTLGLCVQKKWRALEDLVTDQSPFSESKQEILVLTLKQKHVLLGGDHVAKIPDDS